MAKYTKPDRQSGLARPFNLHGGMALTVLVGVAGVDLAIAAATVLRPGRRLWSC